MKHIVFDIETAPLPEEQLRELLPPFDPAAVRVGNLKDPAKIEEKIAEARASHWDDFKRNAALDPLTGRVCAIGTLVFDVQGPTWPEGYEPETSYLLFNPASEKPAEGALQAREAEMLLDFWSMAAGVMGRLNTLIGFNICLFDLPFLLRRSWAHGFGGPFGLRRGRYWGDNVVDLRDLWQLGDRQARGSLDSIARHLGVGRKSGNGADFATLLAQDRRAALDYLGNDLDLTRRIAARLGVIGEAS